MSNRQAAVCLDGVRSNMRPVKNGIPQGSPVSPILSTVYASKLLELMAARQKRLTNPGQQIPRRSQPTGSTLHMYMDDGTLMASSTSLNINVEQL